jgi:hypothetical protein
VGSYGAECDLDALIECLVLPRLVDWACGVVLDALGIPRGGLTDG